MDGSKSRPHGEINMVCSLNIHWHTHGWGMCHEWVCGMVGWHNKACANGLLSKVIIKNLLLDMLHDVVSKVSNHRQIHPRIHQAKRIASGNNTIK